MKFTPAIAAAILLYCNLTSVSAAPVTTPPTSGDVQGLSYIIAGPGPYIPAPDSIRSHNETSPLRTNQLASGHVATSEGERRVFHTETETLADGHRGSGDNLHVLSGEGRAHHSDKRFLLPPSHYNPHPGSHPFQPIRNVATAHHAGNNTVPVSLPGPTPSPTGPTTEPHNSTTPLLPRDPRRHPPFPVHRNPTRESHNGIDAGTVAPILPRGIHLPPFSSNATRASHSDSLTLPIFLHNTTTEAHNGTLSHPHTTEHGLLGTLTGQAAAAAARTCLYGKTCSSVGGALVDTILGDHRKGGKKAQNGTVALGQ